MGRRYMARGHHASRKWRSKLIQLIQMLVYGLYQAKATQAKGGHQPVALRNFTAKH